MLDPVSDCSETINDRLNSLKCIDNIYKARYNALNILINRGYKVDRSLLLMDKPRLKILYDQYLLEKKESSILNCKIINKNCYAKISWIKDKKDAEKVIKDFKKDILELRETDTNIYKNDNLIIILTKNIFLESKDYYVNNVNIENNNVSYFSLSQLQINILNHKLVPKHILLSNSEKQQLENKYKIKCSSLPKIIRFASLDDNLPGDPVARYLGGRTGDVYKIMRNNHSSINPFYRVISDTSNSNLKTSEFQELDIDNIDDYKYSDELIGISYFKNIEDNSSFSGLNLNNLKTIMEYCILTKNNEKLQGLAFEYTSFYILVYRLSEIRNNYKKNRYISTKDLQLVKNYLGKSTIQDLERVIEIGIQSIQQTILFDIIIHIKYIVALYYLDLELGTKVEEISESLKNNITLTVDAELIFSDMLNLLGFFCTKDLKLTLCNIFIHKTLLIPKNYRSISIIDEMKFLQKDYFKDINNSEIEKFLNFSLDMSTNDILKDYQKNMDKLVAESYDLTFIEKYDQRDKALFTLLYHEIITPKLYDTIPSISTVFPYLRELLVSKSENLPIKLYTDTKIDSIWNILIEILKKNSKYNDLLNIVNLYYTWYNENNSPSYKYITYLVNSIIIVLYRDSLFIVKTPFLNITSSESLESTKLLITQNIIEETKTKGFYPIIDKINYRDAIEFQLPAMIIEKDSIIWKIQDSYPYRFKTK